MPLQSATLSSLSPSPTDPSRADNLLIWGVQDGCNTVPDLDRILDRLFYKGGLNTWVLSPPPSSCQGAECAKRLLAQCPKATGRLMGGRIYRTKKAVRLRLWMYDLGTRQTAYYDAICLDCILSALVPNQAQYLWEQHKWGRIPGPTPIYCQEHRATPPSAGSERPWGRKLYLMVYGDGKHKHAVTTAMRDLLLKSARPMEVVSGDRGYAHEELVRIVGPSKDGQVVGIGLTKAGDAALWLYDGPTEKIHQMKIECPSCEAPELNEVLKNNVIPLLAHCFEEDCTRGTAEPLPPEACEPLEEPTCKEDALAAPVLMPISGPGVDPTLAKLVKGSLWGLFAASAATSIALFAANAAGAGQYQSNSGATITHNLFYPACTAAGISAGILGISIPITWYLNRETSQHTSVQQITPTVSPTMQCPK